LIKSILPEHCIWVDIKKDMEKGSDARIITIYNK